MFSKLLRIGLRRPRDIQHLLGILDHYASLIDDPACDVRAFPTVSVDQLAGSLGHPVRITLRTFSGVPASITPVEAYALALLLNLAKAGNAFEFGTYKGLSTTQLAQNLALPGKLHTLDLPEDDPRHALAIDRDSERQIASETGKGVLVPEELRPRIEFLRADSARFDPAPYAGRIDFVFVDGAHSLDYVRNDSEKGWAMLRGGGVMAWHDCNPQHPDVVAYLKASGLAVRLIEGTALAFAVKDGG